MNYNKVLLYNVYLAVYQENAAAYFLNMKIKIHFSENFPYKILKLHNYNKKNIENCSH